MFAALLCPISATNRRPLRGPRCAGIAVACVLFAGLVGGSSRAADSLSVPVTGQLDQQLWPLRLDLQIAPVDGGAAVVRQRVLVADGHALRIHSTIPTPQGKRSFEVELVARHHPGEAIEVEWDLQISDENFRSITLAEYLLRRLNMGPHLRLREPVLRAARSDIASTRREPLRQIVSLGHERYEITITAMSMRG